MARTRSPKPRFGALRFADLAVAGLGGRPRPRGVIAAFASAAEADRGRRPSGALLMSGDPSDQLDGWVGVGLPMSGWYCGDRRGKRFLSITRGMVDYCQITGRDCKAILNF
jgi:hypothetical protein